ncbi:MAG: hypothetical protein SV760_07515, partial [Halobacteria archaeon]|nr:hypothetical protein [Halobacteria archaeon]
NLTVDRGAVGVFVTHLAEDLDPLPDEGRIDGIFAEGLDNDLELQVDYQPRFGELGKSTPEFIVSRLIAESGDRNEKAGFETLARAVGVEKVQRITPVTSVGGVTSKTGFSTSNPALSTRSWTPSASRVSTFGSSS